MSKLSFRARTLDVGKPMPVFVDDEIPELLDFASVNRAVVEMPTGMEKEEETELHLQKVLSARLHNDQEDGVVIPIPEMDMVEERYNKFYRSRGSFKPPKQYIHVQPFGIEQDIPEYDMDSEDESWLMWQIKHLKMEVTSKKFESMMDRLEKASGQTVVSLSDAKALLKVDDELIIAVYDYWLNKRLKEQRALIPQVKMEKRDGSSGNNPYVAFRRRTEKMQTRKNRKNDEASYEKMLKLQKDLKRVLILLEMVKRREKSKKEQLKLTTEVIEKRYQMEDWDGLLLDEANSKKDQLPKFVPLPQLISLTSEWGTSSKELTAYVRKKREYKKRKHRLLAQDPKPFQPSPSTPTYSNHSFLPRDVTSTDDDGAFSPSSPQDDIENEPDGIYTFRRKDGCSYHAARPRHYVGWPWCSRQDGGAADQKYQYSLTSMSHPYSRCIGYSRRRLGRGGRVLLDRGSSRWDDELMYLDLSSSASQNHQSLEYVNYIRTNGIQHYRSVITQRNSYGDPDFYSNMSVSGVVGKAAMEFSVESFQRHQEKLAAMQLRQQQQLRQQEIDMDASSNRSDAATASSSGSEVSSLRYTLDSERAEFAVSALHDASRAHRGLQAAAAAGPGSRRLLEANCPPSIVNSLSSVKSLLLSSSSSGNLSSSDRSRSTGGHQDQLSTSPAASILQLNYPINGATMSSSTGSLQSSSSAGSLQGSTPQLPFSSLQNAKRLAGAGGSSAASSAPTINSVNRSAASRNSGLTVCPVTPLSRLPAVTGVPYVSPAPVGPRITMTVPVGLKQNPQGMMKLGNAPGGTDLLTRESSRDVLSSAAKDKAFPMEVT